MRLSLVLAFLFFIGSCFGWVLELLYRNLTHRHKKWINPASAPARICRFTASACVRCSCWRRWRICT